jgi:hypothetical protein
MGRTSLVAEAGTLGTARAHSAEAIPPTDQIEAVNP